MECPKLEPDLFNVLLNLRTYTKLQSQPLLPRLIHPEDRPLQSILWRDNPADLSQVYELNTVTYRAPAFFQATKCLQKLATHQRM